MPAADAKGARPAPQSLAVIVTGAARGMGRAMTLGLAAAGVRVAAADLASCSAEMSEVAGTAQRQGVHENILPLECDITRWQDCTGAVRAAIDRFGAVHGLVNNAGIAVLDAELAAGRARKRRFYEHEIESWRRVIETNITGSFHMAKAIAPTLVAQGWGRIVNVTTSHTTMVLEGFSPYGPSKAALEAATVIWAKDLAGTGVTVNALLPGGVGNTRMVPSSEYADRSKLVQPDAMIAPIVWLMSPRSDGVSGRRFSAKNWDPAQDASTAMQQAGAAAGW
jgi:NAD(P)-dependent dehydrogenase (short-subunit alcohol dehydrogenase family)